MATDAEPMWADVHPARDGGRQLLDAGLPASGRHVYAQIKPHCLLVGKECEDLHPLPAQDFYAVEWHPTDDNPDHQLYALHLDPAGCVTALLDLYFNPDIEGIEGLEVRQFYPVCWLHDWLCVRGTLDRLFSIPSDWVTKPAFDPTSA